MSAETHVAELLEKEGTRARVRLAIVHADERVICVEKNCALQLLWDAAHPDVVGPCPLNEAMSIENRLDFKWLLENEDRFIESVAMVDSNNYPVPDDMDIAAMRRLQKSDLPHATLDVLVTDQKWIAHLNKGEPWDTALADANNYI